MIKYALQCDQAHAFESWFPDSASYDRQAKRGFVSCPVCGSIKVEKQIMAPRVRNSDERRALSKKKAPPADAAAPQPMAMLSEEAQKMRAAIRDLHEKVKANTEDVGERFADEARKIHYGEVEEKAIRGRANLEEAKALVDEGIGVLPLPPLPDERN
ncbi:MAG: DUF1178 family protein [Beijerinckiaceae bacterium]